MPGVSIAFLGRAKSMEEQLIKRYGYDMQLIPAIKMKRSLLGVLGFGIGYPITILRALMVLGRLKPKLVFATGGYVAGTAGVAAALRGIPLFLQEQNSIPGLASKLLNRLAQNTFLGFPQAAEHLKNKSGLEFTGNPIRDEIGTLTRAEGCRELGISQSNTNVLIIGGSQGAQSINAAMESLLSIYFKGRTDLFLIWQSGSRDEERLASACRNAGVNALVHPFFQKMDAVYSAADIAVCRGGAITLAELSKSAVPMIIIPYRFATANHQEANALYYENLGAGMMIRDDEQLPLNLAEALTRILESKDLREKYSQASRQTFSSNANEMITNKIMELLRKR